MKKIAFLFLFLLSCQASAQVWVYTGYTCSVSVQACQEWLSNGNGAYIIQGSNYTAYACRDIFNTSQAGNCAVISGDPCPAEGSEWNQELFQCETPSICDNAGHPEGSEYNSQTESCQCPPGQSAWLTDGAYVCQGEPPEDDCTEENAQGSYNGKPYCGPPEGECPEGQTGGYVNGGWTCIDEPPQCSPGETYINGSCVGPDDMDYQEEPSPPKDSDGDGQSDSSDGDMDGDGTPNGSDDDVDGDGTSNADDRTPWGEPEDGEDSGSAKTSGSCDIAPTCEGDAIQCAILIQQWQSSCKIEDLLGGGEGGIESGGTESWWESEYPEGLSGIWSEKQGAIENSAMVGWLDSWGVAGSGSCPSFNIDMNLGFINFGNGDLMGNYCYVFDFIRLVILISASLLARRLIFGG